MDVRCIICGSGNGYIIENGFDCHDCGAKPNKEGGVTFDPKRLPRTNYK